MEAQGEHVLIQGPGKQSKTDGGIMLPDDVDQVFAYGRVLSVGPRVQDLGVKVGEDDFVVFEKMGKTDLELDPNKNKDVGLIALHASSIYCTISEAELVARKLPVP